MNVMLLLLFLLVASPSKAKGLDSLVYVGPIVNSVVVGSKTLEPEGDFFRAVLANSEYDPCLRVERVNVRAPNAPRVKASLRYCAVTFGKERLSLAASEQQEAELSNLSWKEFELSFDLSYVAIGPGATRRELRCTLDPRDGRNTILCAER